MPTENTNSTPETVPAQEAVAAVSFNMQEAQAKIAEATDIAQIREVVANVMTFADLIAKKSEELVKEREAEAARLQAIEKAKEEAVAAQNALNEQLKQVQATLAELQAAQAAAEAERKFNERMAAIDDTFELNDEERGLLVSEAKDLGDEAFAKWLDKNKILMREKTKAAIAAAKCAKPKAKGECEKEDEEDETEEEKAKKAKASEVIASAINSASQNIETPKIEQEVTASSKNLMTSLAEAFANSTKIGGKTIKQINEEAQAQKK